MARGVSEFSTAKSVFAQECLVNFYGGARTFTQGHCNLQEITAGVSRDEHAGEARLTVFESDKPTLVVAVAAKLFTEVGTWPTACSKKERLAVCERAIIETYAGKPAV